MARLHCLSPAQERTGRYDLLFQRSILGRSRWCDVTLADPAIRRKHAIIAMIGDDLVISPYHQAAEVLLNGEILTGPRKLAADDVIELGSTRLAVELDDEATPPARAGAEPGLLGGTVMLWIGTFAARILGLLRESVIGRYFGAGGEMDAFVVAFTVANLFRRVFGEHVIEGSVLPVVKNLLARGRKRQAWQTVSSALTLSVSLVAVLMTLCLVAAPWLVRRLAPGFVASSPDLLDTATKMARIMIPYMGLVVLFAFCGTLLLARGKFGVYGIAPAAFSVAIIAAVAVFRRNLGVTALAVGVVSGGVLHLIVQAAALRGTGARLRPRIETASPGTPKVRAMAGPMMLTAAMMSCVKIIDRRLASALPDGSISALWWSFRLVGLPFAVLGLAIARTSFARLAEKSAVEHLGDFGRCLSEALRLCVFLLLPTSALMVILSDRIVILVHQYGKFDAGDVFITSIALKYYSLSLVGWSASALLNRAMYSLFDSRTPLLISMLNLVVNVVLAFILVKTPLKHAGLALATAIAFTVQMLVLGWAIQRKLRLRSGSLPLATMSGAFARMALSTVVLCAVAILMNYLLAEWRPSSVIYRAAALAVPAVAAAMAYLLVARLLRLPEAHRVLLLWRDSESKRGNGN